MAQGNPVMATVSQYFQGEAKALNYDIRFIALVPQQIVGSTDIGHAAATVYGAQQGLTKEQFLEGMRLALDVPMIADFVIDDLRHCQDWGITDKVLDLFNKDCYDMPVIRRAMRWLRKSKALISPAVLPKAGRRRR